MAKIKLEQETLLPLLQAVVDQSKNGYQDIRLKTIVDEVEAQYEMFSSIGGESQASAMLQPFYEFQKFLTEFFPEKSSSESVLSVKLENGSIEQIYLPCICQIKDDAAIRCGKSVLPIAEDFNIEGHGKLTFRFSTVKMGDQNRVLVWGQIEKQDNTFLIPIVLDGSAYDLSEDDLEEKFEDFEKFKALLRPLSTGGGFCRLRDLEIGEYQIMGIHEKENQQYGIVQLVCATPEGERKVELNTKLKRLVEHPYKMMGSMSTSDKERMAFELVKRHGGYLHIMEKEQKPDGRVFVKASIGEPGHSETMKQVKQPLDTVRDLPESQNSKTVDVDVEVSETKEVSETDLENIPF